MLKAMELKNPEKYIESISRQNNEPEWMLNQRLDAYRNFIDKPMPNFVYGLNINLNIDLDLDSLSLENLEKSSLKIKNSNRGVIIEDFEGMLKNHGAVLKSRLMSLISCNEKFTAFHRAFLNDLVFVYLPKNTVAKEPIELASFIRKGIAFEHLIVLAEDNSQFTIIEDSQSDDQIPNEINSIKMNNGINSLNKTKNNIGANNGSYRSKIVEIFIGKNCTANYSNVQLLGNNTFNFTIKKASVGANSTLNWMDCCLGSKASLSEVTTFLDGENAAVNNHGIFFGSKSQQFDLVAKSIHNAPHTVSDILTKGALTGSSKCLYRGLVRIEQNAFGSNGYQKEDTLLLSSDAAADSIPNLEIENNDVRCTHGASIGRIDREKLFYIQSRGLNEGLATREYVKAFFEPLIQKIQIRKLRGSMHSMIEERMGKHD